MVQRSSLYSTSITSASLGPGSALGEKGKKSAWVKKKIGERREPRGSLGREKDGPEFHWARFAHLYFSYLTPFFAELGPRLAISIKTRLKETKTSPKRSSSCGRDAPDKINRGSSDRQSPVIARKFLLLHHGNTRLGCGSRIFLRGDEGAPPRNGVTGHSINDVILIPLELIRSNCDAVRKLEKLI